MNKICKETIGHKEESKLIHKRILFIANTPFQCMISFLIQYKYKFKYSNLIITNSMKNADILQKKFIKSGVFDSVELYKMPDDGIALCKSSFFRSDLPEIVKMEKFDVLCVCISCTSHDLENSCYSELLKHNEKLEVVGYVEGYSSYIVNLNEVYKRLSAKHRIINFLAGVFTYRKYIKKFDRIFAHYPKMIMYSLADHVDDITNWDICQEKEFQEMLFDIFGYSSIENKISEKFIFFEECFSEDNGRQEDFKLVEYLAKLIGTENFVVKRHPRNKINRFEKMGIKTLSNQEIPWEVYALDSNQPEHILLTHSSGAGLNFRFLTSKSDKTILLYRYYKDEEFFIMNNDTKKWFENYEHIFEKFVFVPENKRELDEILKHL